MAFVKNSDGHSVVYLPLESVLLRVPTAAKLPWASSSLALRPESHATNGKTASARMRAFIVCTSMLRGILNERIRAAPPTV
jgi:hypothetical protein